MGKYSTHIKVTTYIYQASFAGERAATVDNPQKGTRRREDGVVENPGRYSGWQDEIVVPDVENSFDEMNLPLCVLGPPKHVTEAGRKWVGERGGERGSVGCPVKVNKATVAVN